MKLNQLECFRPVNQNHLESQSNSDELDLAKLYRLCSPHLRYPDLKALRESMENHFGPNSIYTNLNDLKLLKIIIAKLTRIMSLRITIR